MVYNPEKVLTGEAPDLEQVESGLPADSGGVFDLMAEEPETDEEVSQWPSRFNRFVEIRTTLGPVQKRPEFDVEIVFLRDANMMPSSSSRWMKSTIQSPPASSPSPPPP